MDGLSTMEQCWELLDQEYGKESELVDDQLKTLKNFRYSKGCKGSANKFLELYEVWAKVLTTLEIVKQDHALNHSYIMDEFLGLLPSKDIIQRYVNASEDPKAKGKSILEIVREFMAAERVNQRRILGITKNKEPGKESSEEKACWKCNKTGHMASKCTASSGGNKSHST